MNAAATPATILVIDDTAANLKLVAAALESDGYQVAVAQGGAEGARRALLVAPDLILLDVMMPGEDGFATCRRLKELAPTREVPVIFMTALTDARSKLAGFEAGGVDYVTKPFDTDELLARVRTHLALRSARTELQARHAELQASARRLEEAHAQLLQSERMAAVGQLAAGVAHEINNPIGYVNANLGTLADYVRDLIAVVDAHQAVAAGADPDTARRVLAEVEARVDLPYLKNDVVALLAESQDGLERVRRIVEDLRDFSRVDAGDWLFVDLHQGLESTLNVAASGLRHKACVTREYGALPAVECRPGEINQVFLNLLLNAGQAIGEQGRVWLRTGCEGDAVWVEVADDGCGIPPEVLPRIFDPFFTTQPVGQGTGLGLSLSYAIVQRHHGRIEVDSRLGEGTRFRVVLPVRQPAAP